MTAELFQPPVCQSILPPQRIIVLLLHASGSHPPVSHSRDGLWQPGTARWRRGRRRPHVGAWYACRQSYAAARFPPRALLSQCPPPLTDHRTARVGGGIACDDLVAVPFRAHRGSGGVSAIAALDLLEVHIVSAVGPLRVQAPPPPDPFDVHPRRRSPPMPCRRCLTCSTWWRGWWKRDSRSQATGVRPRKGGAASCGW